MTTRAAKRHGMNWIRKDQRLAIYLRDGMACVWCGDGVEDGATLTLDHCTPYVRGGSNAASNLVTACRRCNSARGARSLRVFAAAVVSYLDGDDVMIDEILANIRRSRRRVPDRAAAKTLIARRGGFVEACKRRNA